ncbi:MAG: sulfite exporter TauE/SafE family protein, partial [Patescibacteria group bacterium]
MRKQTYFVKGMHCASCEMLIEKRIREIKGVEEVESSTSKGEVVITFGAERRILSAAELNEIFKKHNYIFSEKPISEKNSKIRNPLITLGMALLVIIVFLVLDKIGLSGLVNVSSSSSLPTFFLFGILAGISSCAALVGGIILSMSKQWGELYPNEDSPVKKAQPHLMFNVGRLFSYVVLGAVLGVIGSRLQLSLKITSFLVIAVSLMMILLALQMLGFK